MNQCEEADNVADRRPLRRVHDPRVLNTFAVKPQEVGVLRDDNTPFRMRSLQ